MRTYVTDMPNGDQPGGRPHLCTQTYVRSANLLTQADAHVRTYGHTYVGARGGACNAQSGTPPGPDTYVRTYVASLAVSLLPEREWPERDREWERASLSSSMMTTQVGSLPRGWDNWDFASLCEVSAAVSFWECESLPGTPTEVSPRIGGDDLVGQEQLWARGRHCEILEPDQRSGPDYYCHTSRGSTA